MADATDSQLYVNFTLSIHKTKPAVNAPLPEATAVCSRQTNTLLLGVTPIKCDQSITGRYVSIAGRSGHVMSFYEIEIYGRELITYWHY